MNDCKKKYDKRSADAYFEASLGHGYQSDIEKLLNIFIESPKTLFCWVISVEIGEFACVSVEHLILDWDI